MVQFREETTRAKAAGGILFLAGGAVVMWAAILAILNTQPGGFMARLLPYSYWGMIIGAILLLIDGLFES